LVVCVRRGADVHHQDGMACIFVPLLGEHGWR
jgi:hypothetical protein